MNRLITIDKITEINTQTLSLILLPAKVIAHNTALKLNKPAPMSSIGIEKNVAATAASIAPASP